MWKICLIRYWNGKISIKINKDPRFSKKFILLYPISSNLWFKASVSVKLKTNLFILSIGKRLNELTSINLTKSSWALAGKIKLKTGRWTINCSEFIMPQRNWSGAFTTELRAKLLTTKVCTLEATEVAPGSSARSNFVLPSWGGNVRVIENPGSNATPVSAEENTGLKNSI